MPRTTEELIDAVESSLTFAQETSEDLKEHLSACYSALDVLEEQGLMSDLDRIIIMRDKLDAALTKFRYYWTRPTPTIEDYI